MGRRQPDLRRDDADLRALSATPTGWVHAELRGLTITGDLTANGNNFGISFSVVLGGTDIKGNAGAFVRNVFCGSATVPSSNATLLDNFGIEPSMDLPVGICE